MSACTPSAEFEAAAAYLSVTPALSKVSNDVKLQLYALFKCITVSHRPTTTRPSLFDFTGRAKWDAWDKLGKENDHPVPYEWEARYLEIARSLGWQEGIQDGPGNQGETNTTEKVFQGDSDGGRSGMGVSVSSIPRPPPDVKDQDTIHSFALSNDAEGLLSFLETHQGISLDSVDDYGYMPLHLAADRGNKEILKILLDKGADATVKDSDGLTALELAEIGGHEEIVEMIRGHTS